MWRFKRNVTKQPQSATAVAEPADDFPGTTDELFAEIRSLAEATRGSRDRETERRLLRIRHIAGIRLLDPEGDRQERPTPDFAALSEGKGVPETSPDKLTPELLRAGILRNGCILVRGLVDGDASVHLAGQVDRAFAERERLEQRGSVAEGYYEEFELDPRRFRDLSRPWIKEGGGVLAIDSPMLAFEMMEMFEAAGLPRLVEGYLGEAPLISAHKTTLRKAEPSVPGAWHQDGAFMGDVNALNLWVSLSRCGDESPGLDIVPRRFEEYIRTQTDEALLTYQVSQRSAEEAAGDSSIVRPIFEPGDALFFDELCLHKTGSDPSMPNARFAIESWFFGGSGFPEEYAPVAV